MKVLARVVAVLGVVLGVVVTAGVAGAATLRIPMTSFKDGLVRDAVSATTHAPGGVYSFDPALVPATVGWVGYYRLRLPVNTLVKSVRYYHRGLSGGASTISFSRSRFAQPSTLLASGSSGDNSGDLVAVPLVWEPGAQRRIRPGFTYTLGVTLQPTAGVAGVEVEY